MAVALQRISDESPHLKQTAWPWRGPRSHCQPKWTFVLRGEMEKSLNVYSLLQMRYSGESGTRNAAVRLAQKRAHLFNSVRDSDK
jgi:hypothetical protein